MAQANAWVLNLGGGHSMAIGEREMIHLVDQPRLESIPHTPAHCHDVVLWEGEILPVMDMASWLGLDEGRRESVCVVAWQPRPDVRPGIGALVFSGMPLRVLVDDDQACDLPETPAGWGRVAQACFTHEGRPVPILDLAFVFSGALTGHAGRKGGAAA